MKNRSTEVQELPEEDRELAAVHPNQTQSGSDEEQHAVRGMAANTIAAGAGTVMYSYGISSGPFSRHPQPIPL